MSDPMTRGVMFTGHAALVLPYDPVRDRVLLVEQFRTGPLLVDDPSPWSLEPVAGMVDPGETPQATARREALEEAGLTLTHLDPAGTVYPSPGTSSEIYHHYVGLCDLPDDAAGLGGLASEQEDIKSHLMAADRLIARADQGQLRNGPLQLLALWLARHRVRLQALS